MNAPADSGIDDPSDWPQNCRSVAALDTALRCPVCMDLYKTPMQTRCGHHFCSVCIRERILANAESGCPTCRLPVTEAELTRNRLVDEVVQHFALARPVMLQLATAPAVAVADDEAVLPTSKRKRTSEGNRRSARLAAVVSDQEDGDDDDDFIDDKEGTVQCPVCNDRFPSDSIEAHVNACLEGTAAPRQNRPRAASPSPSPPQRQPRRLYHAMKEKQLRELLQKDCLDTSGTRDTLVRRHRQWTLLVNANLDAARPQSAQSVRQQLRQWETGLQRDMADRERARQASTANGGSTTNGDSGAWNDDALRRHATAHDASYQALIEQARTSAKAKRREQQQQQPEEEEV
ncbi:E3 ubiquitin-protein ligase rad18 [Sorochytrium milnesiophthora]